MQSVLKRKLIKDNKAFISDNIAKIKQLLQLIERLYVDIDLLLDYISYIIDAERVKRKADKKKGLI